MKKAGFVILHYCAIEMTIQCVESIRTVLDWDEYRIVIVDNCSPDDSGQILNEMYLGDNKITVIHTEANLGFSKGNNMGYKYLRENYHPDLILVLNNDVVFKQKDFIQKCVEIYNVYHYHVLGPDIENLNGFHQNPHRNCAMNIAEINKLLFKKRIFLLYFYIKKYLYLESRIQILEKMFRKRDENNRQSNTWQMTAKDVVLQGSCIIVSKDFIKQEKEVFKPLTFMYGEEDILTYHCMKKGYCVLYSPEIQILHYEGVSTQEMSMKSIEKKIFVYKHIISGLICLKKLMES